MSKYSLLSALTLGLLVCSSSASALTTTEAICQRNIASKTATVTRYDGLCKTYGDRVTAQQKVVDDLTAQKAASGLSKKQISLLNYKLNRAKGTLNSYKGRQTSYCKRATDYKTSLDAYKKKCDDAINNTGANANKTIQGKICSGGDVAKICTTIVREAGVCIKYFENFYSGEARYKTDLPFYSKSPYSVTFSGFVQTGTGTDNKATGYFQINAKYPNESFCR